MPRTILREISKVPLLASAEQAKSSLYPLNPRLTVVGSFET